MIFILLSNESFKIERKITVFFVKNQCYYASMVKNFNKSTDQPRFIHKPNPFAKRSWQIFELRHKGQYEPVGEYTLVNLAEDPEITEKKVANVVKLLNKKKDLIDLTNLTKTRVLFTVVPEAQSPNQTKIIFRDYDGGGVSKDNAIFTIRKGVLHV